MSIFGHVPSGLWPCLLTAAELFGIPANELICHLLMLLIKRERERGDASISPGKLVQIHVASLFQDVHLFA